MIIDGVEFPDFCFLCGGEMKKTLNIWDNGVICQLHDQGGDCVGLGIWKKMGNKSAEQGKFLIFSGIWKGKENNGHELTLDEFERYLKLRSFE